MSQKELLEAISRQVHQQTDQILADAAERAARIVLKAEAELEQIKAASIEEARHAVKAEEVKIVNNARLGVKRELLAAKSKLVEKVMEGLDAALVELPRRKDYPEIMQRLLQEALEGADGAVTVRCRSEDRALVGDLVRRLGATATVAVADIPRGGVEVSWGEGGRFIRRNTFASRMEKIYSELLKEANRIVFSAERQP